MAWGRADTTLQPRLLLLTSCVVPSVLRCAVLQPHLLTLTLCAAPPLTCAVLCWPGLAWRVQVVSFLLDELCGLARCSRVLRAGGVLYVGAAP